MSGDRFNYYLKIIMNSILEDLSLINEQFENDPFISSAEAGELERVLNRQLNLYNRFSLKVVNSTTGREETPPKSELDNFGNTSEFLGTENAFGIEWRVYGPTTGFANSPVKRWYFNRKIATLLNDILKDGVPGKVKDYFDYPPWIMGTPYAPGTLYMPINEMVNLAIARGLIPDWDYLVTRGLPKPLVDLLKAENLDSTL
jgi:hypothetical protein